MATTQMVFERYERKYLLTPSAKAAVLAAMENHMQLDRYGKTTIRNIHFDTDDFDVIRTSLSGPEYKEKLRIRSYSQVNPDEEVFVELKKKYRGIVYKRRIEIPEFQAMDWLLGGGEKPEKEVNIDKLLEPGSGKEPDQPNFRQIADEIDWFFRRYKRSGMAPKVFLSYEREAYAPVENSETPEGFRITLDTNILARRSDLSLRSGICGDQVIDKDTTVMEVKIPKESAMPLWLAHCLSRNEIIRSSFSKYGRYYQETAGARQKIIGTMEREDLPALHMKGELLYV